MSYILAFVSDGLEKIVDCSIVIACNNFSLCHFQGVQSFCLNEIHGYVSYFTARLLETIIRVEVQVPTCNQKNIFLITSFQISKQLSSLGAEIAYKVDSFRNPVEELILNPYGSYLLIWRRWDPGGQTQACFGSKARLDPNPWFFQDLPRALQRSQQCEHRDYGLWYVHWQGPHQDISEIHEFIFNCKPRLRMKLEINGIFGYLQVIDEVANFQTNQSCICSCLSVKR